MSKKLTNLYRNTVEVKKVATGHVLVAVKTGEIVQAQATLDMEQAAVLFGHLQLALAT